MVYNVTLNFFLIISIYILHRIMARGNFEMNILLCKPKYISTCVLLHSPFHPLK